MTKLVQLATYADLLNQAQEQLSRDKAHIFKLYPLHQFNRESYAFAYLRAERIGMTAINRRLAELRWLPVHLDTSEETLAFNRESLKRWLKSTTASPPGSGEFGNDFIHAMTRCALKTGWASKDFHQLIRRTSQLFSELSCLVGIVYYCQILLEQGVEVVGLNDPNNLPMTALEFASMFKASAEAQRWHKAELRRQQKATANQGKPKLQLVKTEMMGEEFEPV